MERFTRNLPTWALVAITAVAIAVIVVGRSPVHVAAASTAPPASPHEVTVTGTGTAQGIPNRLTVDMSVHRKRPTVQGSLSALHTVAKQLFASVEKAGVAKKDLKTTDFDIDRHYTDRGVRAGWEASEDITATITPLTLAGPAIQAAENSAGTGVTIGQISIDVGQDKPLLAKARRNAFVDAKTKAAQFAGLAGEPLGQVANISEKVSNAQPIPYPSDDFDALSNASAGVARLDEKSVVLQSGRQPLTVHVTVRWTLN